MMFKLIQEARPFFLSVVANPMDITFDHPVFLFLAGLQLILAIRSKHTMGVLIGMQSVGSLFGKRYGLLDGVDFGHSLPQMLAIRVFAVWVLLLLLIRLRTLSPTKGKKNPSPIVFEIAIN